MYAKYGVNPLDCDHVPTREEIDAVRSAVSTPMPLGKEAAYVSCDKECTGDPDCINECVSQHADSTIDRCTQKCQDHGVKITPTSATVECGTTNKANFSASGGKPPYSWKTTAGELRVSGLQQENAELTPKTNSGSAVSGGAYAKSACFDQGGHAEGGITHIGIWTESRFGCNDGLIGCFETQPLLCTPTVFYFNDLFENCENHLGHPVQGNCSGVVTCGLSFKEHSQRCTLAKSKGGFCDLRTPGMSSQGCEPCGVQFGQTAVVTVSDSRGKSASAVATS
jgi:hypothetical protein